ncbi:hypothetical protein BGZ76_004011 [Entomortierella beljakovae]|nr:hypothetical protein BGZ76_004011 [Entomortierella beljakovae]
MPDFARSFDFTVEQDAYLAFEVTMESTTLSKNARKIVLQQYDGSVTMAMHFGPKFKQKIKPKAVKAVLEGSDNITKRYTYEYSKSAGPQSLNDENSNDLGVPRQKKPRLSPPPNRNGASSTCYTPPYHGGSVGSSPKLSTTSPPLPPVFTLDDKTVQQEAEFFFTNTGTMQDILLSNLQEGKRLPPWVKNRPIYMFDFQLTENWGPRVTKLYEEAKTKPVLDHTHVDDIAYVFALLFLVTILLSLLSGIVHFNNNHTGFSQPEISKISGEVLSMFYSKDMEDADMKRAVDATNLWANWVQLVIIMLRIRLWLVIIYVNYDCTNDLIFSANACTATGKTRKVNLQQSGQSRQPDVIGQTEDGNEVFFGEMKGMHPGLEAVNTDVLRLAIFTKDSLDLLHNTLERAPPLVTFQTVGSEIVFFLGARVNNTIVHMRLSTVKLPSSLKEVDLDYDFFFRLFQIQNLINLTKDCLEEKRSTPLQEESFPTLGTPERYAALSSPKKPRKSRKYE